MRRQPFTQRITRRPPRSIHSGRPWQPPAQLTGRHGVCSTAGSGLLLSVIVAVLSDTEGFVRSESEGRQLILYETLFDPGVEVW